jgi:hypothetical protein
MAAVGGMLASAVIKVVIGQIASAKTRSITDNSALLWLKRLKDAMYDISDMLDDFEADTNLV